MKNWKRSILVIALLGCSLVFLASTLLLLVGMAPTVVAALVDKSKERLKAVTVGCVNLGFCFPYWLDLVTTEHTPERALKILEPQAVIFMYLGAAVGYFIEWVCVTISISMTQQKNQKRLTTIKDEQQKLKERWGVEVMGLQSHELAAEGGVAPGFIAGDIDEDDEDDDL
ncbi:MAG: hypothetical protein AB7E85_05385 [Pseudobdellovibrionaceae bacterium]